MIYTCQTCRSRYHAQTWCTPCGQPTTRLGPGGTCPACQHPITTDELHTTAQPLP